MDRPAFVGSGERDRAAHRCFAIYLNSPRSSPSSPDFGQKFYALPLKGSLAVGTSLHSKCDMRMTSFAYQGDELKRVQVELELLKGLPGMTILGLPDPLIRESVHRIQSALLQQGFEWPSSQKIVVHLMPPHGRKSGAGLDLPMALLLLEGTGQWQPPWPLSENFHAYGGLTLSGEVSSAEADLNTLPPPRTGDFLITGSYQRPPTLWRAKSIKNLRHALDMFEEDWSHPKAIDELWVRPKIPQLKLPVRYKRWISAMILGEHHTLLSGIPGTGKSTLAKSIIGFRSSPTEDESFQILQTHRSVDSLERWRPVVSPHHTCSSLALLGGGVPIRAGALSRSHGGLLVMDELLEFKPQVQEALREPLEEGQVHLYRGHHYKTFPTQFQMVATTNLCPCGYWVPGTVKMTSSMRCKCSLKNLKAYQSKLSGPILDRIALWAHMTPLGGAEESFYLPDLKEELGALCLGEFKPAQRLSFEELKPFWTDQARDRWAHLPYQLRRKLQWARVAKTLSDLDGQGEITETYLEEAAQWALEPFFYWQTQ